MILLRQSPERNEAPAKRVARAQLAAFRRPCWRHSTETNFLLKYGPIYWEALTTNSTVMRVWKQWTDEHQKPRKTGSRRRNAESTLNDRHLLRMTVNNRTASSRQLAARLSTATSVLMSASTIHSTVDCVQVCLYTGSPSRQTIDGCV
ncbi:hypothetical protein TNCV_2721591 [Trichonephila clavipes]|nr:hypothetical protein TNCV_1352181 [Trichonephila clavipes]GFV24388.1 hypothetical protein TNCV_2721591 [Trichonephila clavipes]